MTSHAIPHSQPNNLPDRFLPGQIGPCCGEDDDSELILFHQDAPKLNKPKDDPETLRHKEALEFEQAYEDTLERLLQYSKVFEEGTLLAEREQEVIQAAAESLQYQLDRIARIQPDQWSRQRKLRELERAVEILADAEAELDTELGRLAKVGGWVSPGSSWAGPIGYWLKSRLAFALPLLVFLAIASILVLTALGIM